MRRTGYFSILLAALLIFTGGCASSGSADRAEREREFREKVNKGKTIAVLPPVTQFFKRTNLGNEPMTEYNDLVFENVSLGLDEALGEMGYTVKPAGINDEILYADQELARDLTNVRNDFNRAMHVLSSSRGDADIRFSPLVNVFAERSGADLLLMAQGYGFETSGGKKTKDAVMAGVGALFGYIPSVRFTGTQIVVMLVDGVSGELLWVNYNGGNDTGYNAKDRQEMSDLTSRILSPLKN